MKQTYIRMREWETRGPEDPSLRGVRLDEEARSWASLLKRDRRLEIDGLDEGLRIRSGAHVGRIRLGHLTVTVEPKLGSTTLLELVRYAFGLRDLRQVGDADLGIGSHGLQDLIAQQLLTEVTELTQRGLTKTYVARREDLTSPRGHIDFASLARRPVTTTTLPCQHHVRLADHPLNRVVRAGLRLGARVAEAADLKASLSRIAARLEPDVGDAPLSLTSLGRAERGLNRLTEAYAATLRLIRLLLEGNEVSLEDDQPPVPLNGFLFDMNRFFQTLVGRFLMENLAGCTVQSEHALRDFMRYAAGLNPRNRARPTPRPDFAVRDGSTVARLLDAKYRDLWERELPREMLYQLAMYALSQPRPATAAILFPTTTASATPAVVELLDPVLDQSLGRVELRPIHLETLLAAIRGPEAGRQTLARTLAFGASPPRATLNASA